uniref:Putative ovule protein n=1 Tax=Solanum chacoense TaxID=4108 RepID=A0A0V0GNK5_SOLCH
MHCPRSLMWGGSLGNRVHHFPSHKTDLYCRICSVKLNSRRSFLPAIKNPIMTTPCQNQRPSTNRREI